MKPRAIQALNEILHEYRVYTEAEAQVKKTNRETFSGDLKRWKHQKERLLKKLRDVNGLDICE